MVALKEGLVRTDDFGILLEASANFRTKLDDCLKAIGWQEAVADDFRRTLPNSIYATGPLNKANDRPRKVEINNDRAVLKVLTFAENIRRYEDAQF